MFNWVNGKVHLLEESCSSITQWQMILGTETFSLRLLGFRDQLRGRTLKKKNNLKEFRKFWRQKICINRCYHI